MMIDEADIPLADGSDIPVTPRMIEAGKEILGYVADCSGSYEHTAIWIYRAMHEARPDR
jgi:hypothetical protein